MNKYLIVDFLQSSVLWCSAEEAQKYAKQMLGAKLITKQTGAGGRVCNAVRFPHTNLHTSHMNSNTKTYEKGHACGTP